MVCDANRAICWDVAVAWRITSCIWFFHWSCLCSVRPRYLYVSTIVILKDDKVSVNAWYALGNVRLLKNMIICVLEEENVTFHVDAHVLSLSSVCCMCCMTGVGSMSARAADTQITKSSANMFMCMNIDSMIATRSWI